MPFWSYFAVPFFWVVSFFLSSAYDPKRIFRIIDELQTVIFSIILGFLLFAGFTFLLGLEMRRSLFLAFILADMLVLIGWRAIYRIYDNSLKKDETGKVILIIGATEAGRLIAETISRRPVKDLKVVGFLDDECRCHEEYNGPPVLGKTDKIKEVIKAYKVEEVIFALPNGQYTKVVELVLAIDEIPVRVRVIPTHFRLTYHRVKAENFYGIPLIGFRDPTLNEVQLLFKRIFDSIFASIGLLLIWPLMLTIAIAIRLDSKGPIFFRQSRLGENGLEFKMLKFRTMYHEYSNPAGNATTISGNGHGKAADKVREDPRVTGIGRILRRTSLDEIPQLINIWRGDMSFVGPRPEMPWRVSAYEPWQRARFSVPQGLTGWWQVNGRSDKPMHLNTQDDLYYIENYSIWLDFQILLKTPLVVLRGKGAF